MARRDRSNEDRGTSDDRRHGGGPGMGPGVGGPGMGSGGPERGRGRGGKKPRIAHDAPDSQNITLFSEDGDNAFAESVEQGHRVDPRAQKIFIMCVITVAVFAIALVIPKNMLNEALTYGGYNQGYTFSWFVEDLQANVNGVVGIFTGHDAEVGYSYVLFRYIIIILTGAGLALCGAVYQGSFKNALVSPSSMGVMSGASAGMLLWVLFYVNDTCSNVPWISNIDAELKSAITAGSDPWEYLWASYSMSLYSFAGCFLIAGIVLLTMMLSKKSSTSGLMIIITGQVVGGIIGSVTGMVRYYMTEVDGFEDKLELLNNISIGSFYRDYSWIDVVAVGIPIILCVIVVMKLRQHMMVLSMGNEQARSMGVDSKFTQLAVVAASTLLTAIIICFCGRVGFVGFFIPHLARRMVGPNFKFLLPASMALGGLFVMAAFLIVSCTLGPEYETMVGMFISIGGSAIFLVQALRGVGGGGGLGRGVPR